MVSVLAHDVQRASIEAVGGSFLRFASALQIDHGRSEPLGDNPNDLLKELDEGVTNDLLTEAASLAPDALLIDSLRDNVSWSPVLS